MFGNSEQSGSSIVNSIKYNAQRTSDTQITLSATSTINGTTKYIIKDENDTAPTASEVYTNGQSLACTANQEATATITTTSGIKKIYIVFEDENRYQYNSEPGIITLSNTINYSAQSENYDPDFGVSTEGYAAAPAAKTITINNTGDATIKFTQDSSNSTNYIVNVGTAATIQSGKSGQFTVQPKTGLSEGNYNTTIKLNATNADGQTLFTLEFPVKFSVSAPVTGSYDYQVKQYNTTGTFASQNYPLEIYNVNDTSDSEVAYCINMQHSIGPKSKTATFMKESNVSADEFKAHSGCANYPEKNATTQKSYTNEELVNHVKYVLYYGYPNNNKTSEGSSLQSQYGINDPKDMYIATQAAIWHFTDYNACGHYSLNDIVTSAWGSSVDVSSGMQSVYDFLINDNITEDSNWSTISKTQLSLYLNSAKITTDASHKDEQRQNFVSSNTTPDNPSSDTISLTVTKKWEGFSDSDTKPDSIQFELYRGETRVDTYTLTSDENWTKTISGLEGSASEYSVKELTTGNFTSEVKMTSEAETSTETELAEDQKVEGTFIGSNKVTSDNAIVKLYNGCGTAIDVTETVNGTTTTREAYCIQEGDVFKAKFLPPSTGGHSSTEYSKYKNPSESNLQKYARSINGSSSVTKAALLKVLYNGYPVNGGQLREKYNIPDGTDGDAQFRYATEAAIHTLANGTVYDEYKVNGSTHEHFSGNENLWKLYQELIKGGGETVPEGYWLNVYVSPTEQRQNLINIEGSESNSTGFTITNTKAETTVEPATLTINKTGKDDKVLAGAVFTLYRDENCTNEVKELTATNDDGQVTVSTNELKDSDLPASDTETKTLYLKETTAPDGYKLLDTKYTVTITRKTENNVTTYSISASDGQQSGSTITVKNSPIDEKTNHSSLTIYKVDNNNQALKGAKFALYSDEDCANKIKDLDATDENGQVVVNTGDSDLATYLPADGKSTTIYLKETTAPTGYTASKTVYPITLKTKIETTAAAKTTSYTITYKDENNNVSDSVTVVNQPITDTARTDDSLTISKTDENDQPLAGAEFTVYTDEDCKQAISGSIAVGQDGEDKGKAVISTNDNFLANYLPKDNDGTTTLYLKETKAPIGYAKDDTTVYTLTIKKSGSSAWNEDHSKYVTTTSYTITTSNGQNGITVKNSPDAKEKTEYQELTINKVDSDGNTLNDAKFTLYSDKACTNAITDENAIDAAEGTATISAEADDLRPYLPTENNGTTTIYLKETTVPEGYTASDAVYPITLGRTLSEGWNQEHTEYSKTTTYTISYNNSRELRIENEKQDITVKNASLKINKVDNNNQPLDGAEFTLYSDSECKNVIPNSGTISAGTAYINTSADYLSSLLPTADGSTTTIYLKETKAPTGYKLNDTPYEIVIGRTTENNVTTYSITCNGSSTLEVKNQPDTTQDTKHTFLTINKVDNDGKTLKGAKFTLYSDEDCTNTITDENVLDAADGTVTISTEADYLTNYLPTEDNGTKIIYLKETTAPTGYTASTTVYPITLGTNIESVLDQTSGKFVTTTYYTINSSVGNLLTVTNTPVTGKETKDNSLTIKKFNEDEQPLAGAVFTLYSDSDCNNVVKEITETNDNGQAFVNTKDLTNYIPEAGKTTTLYLKETKAPEGYKVSDKVYPITLGTNVSTAWNSDKTAKVTTTTHTITSNNAAEVAVVNQPIVNVSVEKKWDDSQTVDHSQNSVTVLLYQTVNNERTYKDAVVLNENKTGSNWTYTWKDLPKFDKDGNEIVYSVEEPNQIQDYKSEVTNNGNGSFTITNKTQKTSVPVEKKWANGASGERAEIVLYADDQPTDRTLTLTEKNQWKGSFTDLNKYDEDGNEIKYTVKENTSNWDYTVAEDSNGGYIVTNSPSTATVDVPVEKKWADGASGESAEIVLYADDQPTEKTLTLTEETQWKGSFTGLDKYGKDGHEIVYTVKEDTSKWDYTVTEDGNGGYIVTNSPSTATVDVPVEKKWADGASGESAEIVLVKDGQETNQTLTLDSGNDWKGSFEGLDKYGKDGHEIVYTVTENTSNWDYTVTEDGNGGFIVTNSPRTATVDIPVTKKWADGASGEKAIVVLTQNGKETEQRASLREENNWTYTFEDLPKYDSSGNLIEYSVVEEENNYKCDVVKNDDGSITVTNSQSVEEKEVSFNKIWDDNHNETGGRPSADEFAGFVKLYNDTPNGNEKVTEVTGYTPTVTDNGNDTYTITYTGLPKYRADGTEINYYLEEEAVDDYITINKEEPDKDMISAGQSFVNTRSDLPTLSTTAINVTKVWNDGNDADGFRPQNIQVQLYADGVASGSPVALNAENNWNYTWETLSQYNDDGSEIDYTVAEVDTVEGYTTSVSGDMTNGFTITNTYTVDIPVNKEWADGEKGEKADIILKNGDETVDTVTLNEDNNWQHTFEDLPKYDSDGNEINYTVEEENVDYYYNVVKNSDGSITVTNYATKIDIPVEKRWADGASGEKAVIVVKNGDEIVDTVELNEANGWKHVFTDLPKYDKNGNVINYTVDEETDSYRYEITSDGNGGWIITNYPLSTAVTSGSPKTGVTPDNYNAAFIILAAAGALTLIVTRKYRKTVR